jgi:choline dehydrogenase-like flavoprotein
MVSTCKFDDLDCLVIGSGPAAMAAVMALIAKGRKVTILDVGTNLEDERQTTIDRMASQKPEDWDAGDLSSITGRGHSDKEPIHSKTAYGSSFSFDHRGEAVDVRWVNKGGFNYSLAVGGLSNVWGSAMLPYRQKDIEDWPICLDDLEDHYRAVMDFVPCTRYEDELETILPSYSVQQNTIKLSEQGNSFLHDLSRSNSILRRTGIYHGKSRLAIRASDGNGQSHCQYCNLCLSGCPYGLIYSSAHTLRNLLADKKVEYLKNHFVEKLETAGDNVTVTGRNLETGTTFTIHAQRVFLGAGVLPTAKIVLNSLGLFETPVALLDSQYFIYPVLRLRKPVAVESERMHTTSQVIMEVDDARISPYLIHLQIYGYSSFLHAELNRTFLKWFLKIPWLRRQFLGRLMIAQGFMHSEESGDVELTLKKSQTRGSFLSAKARRSGHTLATTLKVGLKLLRNTLNTRTLPLLPGLQFPKPGSGYHSGGTFPMRENPGKRETDTLGRLPSLQRVHLVDSSVFPSIPATSITMSVMANAHRIATLACTLDEA